MFRYRKTTKLYSSGQKSPKKDLCPFCHLEDKEINPLPRRIVKETKHALVLNALYAYDVWEFRDVTDHIMIIPKRHTHTMSELNDDERKEIMDLMCEFEGQDYNVYARSSVSVQRSVAAHQHTHLIKTTGPLARGGFYWKKPYIVWKY